VAKQTVQKFVFKIHTTKLRRSNWNLTLTLQKARKNEEIISLADSTVLRWLDELTNNTNVDEKLEKKSKD